MKRSQTLLNKEKNIKVMFRSRKILTKEKNTKENDFFMFNCPMKNIKENKL